MASPKKETGTTETAQAAAPKFTVKRQLTFPQLKFVGGVPGYFQPTGPYFEGRERKKKDGSDSDRKPPILCQGIDLMTGQLCQIIVNAKIKQVWDDNYPDNGYVDKQFMITKGDKKETADGASFVDFEVVEIEVG